jgi:glycosyltransferase involved in cell wall biosynthesis
MVLELSRTRGLSFARSARRLEKFIFCEATRVCAVSNVLAEMLVEMGVERERVFTTPNGVHLEQFDFADRAAVRAAARTELGLPQEALVLGFVGYYRDWHRLDLVIEALVRMPHAVLALVGEGPAAEQLRDTAARCGVAARVHFCGIRAHAAIPALLPAFDIALVPAINPYASPLKLHEYMAASLATIAPDQPNLREVLEHDVNALLVPSGDGDALAGALLRLADDSALRTRLGTAARRTIESRDLTWRGNAARVIGEVQNLRAQGIAPW